MDADFRNIVPLSTKTDSENEIEKDFSTTEIPGKIDMTVYEQYGLIFDKQKDYYTYNGNIVRYFNDWRVGAGFTNFFTGTIDIEAEYDDKNQLIGIIECSQETYDFHTSKMRNLLSMSADTAQENGTGQDNKEQIKDYEVYGVSYYPQNNRWCYDGEEIKILIDSERPFVYSTDDKGVCLVVNRDESHNITAIKTISENDAQLLLQENKPNATVDFTVEGK